MKIKYIYNQNLDLSEKETNFLFKDSMNFGSIEKKTYSSRSGVLDLLTIVEASLTFSALTSIKAFTKGFIDEDWFEKLGNKTRQNLVSEMIKAKNFIKAYFDVFIRNKKNKQEAFVISETIGEVTLYVVINHYKMTDKLLEKLPQALVDTYGKISLEYISVESKICQLFPDFKNNDWRYLFTPTSKGFGDFVDQYFDLKTNRQIQIKSKLDFVKKFNLIDENKYKLIINALINR